MLPYVKSFLLIQTKNNFEFANSWLNSKKFPFVTRGESKSLYKKPIDVYDGKAKKGFEAVSSFKKIKQKAKDKLSELLSHTFNVELTDDKNIYLSDVVRRILKNRDVRIFIETLIMGGCSFEFVSKSLPEKYRMSPQLEEKDIMEYCDLFFNYELMDDYDWQLYLKKLHKMYELYGDPVYLNEYEEKNFALRHRTSEVVLRCGLKGQLKYSQMLSHIGVKVFDKIVRDFDSGQEWNEVKSTIDCFRSVGEAFKKHHDPSEDEQAFSGIEYETINDSVDNFPILENDVLEYVNSENKLPEDEDGDTKLLEIIDVEKDNQEQNV